MRVTVVSGGTDGMGLATVKARLERGDEVVAIGSNPAKGRALPDGVHFLRADLSSVAETRRVIDTIRKRWPRVDALALFANRQAPHRRITAEGFEQTFALYYLSRYLLSHGLREQLDAADRPVIVNVAGVGITKGEIHWNDLELANAYGVVKAQLQAARANDLLGVDFARHSGGRARYVLYHPGFTRSGDASALPPAVRVLLRAAATFARPVEKSIVPIVEWIENPPAAAFTADDRGRPVPLETRTLNPDDARRLARVTEQLLAL